MGSEQKVPSCSSALRRRLCVTVACSYIIKADEAAKRPRRKELGMEGGGLYYPPTSIPSQSQDGVFCFFTHYNGAGEMPFDWSRVLDGREFYSSAAGAAGRRRSGRLGRERSERRRRLLRPGAAAEFARAARSARAAVRVIRNTAGHLRTHLRAQRGRRGVDVRTIRGGRHPVSAQLPEAAGYHLIHDRPAGTLQVIGTDAGGRPTMAHQWDTAPAVVRPARGTETPNMDIPILGPIQRIGERVMRVVHDVGHLFDLNR